MKIRITEMTEIDLYHNDGIVESSETTLNEDDEYDLIKVKEEDGNTTFQFSNGDCFSIDNNNFEVVESDEETEYEISRSEIKVCIFKAKSLEDAMAQAQAFNWLNKNVASVQYEDTGFQD